MLLNKKKPLIQICQEWYQNKLNNPLNPINPQTEYAVKQNGIDTESNNAGFAGAASQAFKSDKETAAAFCKVLTSGTAGKFIGKIIVGFTD